MTGDERTFPEIGERSALRPSLLNPLYLLACELAAARQLATAPLGRILAMDLGHDWHAQLSSDSSGINQDAAVNHYALVFSHSNGTQVHMGPFTPRLGAAEHAQRLTVLLRSAILIAEASSEFEIDEDLLLDCAESMADAGIAQRVWMAGDPLLQALGKAATLLQRLV